MVFDHVGRLFGKPPCSPWHPGALGQLRHTTGDSTVLPSLGHLFSQGFQIRGCDAYRFAEFAPTWAQFCAGGFDPCIDQIYPLSEGSEGPRAARARSSHGKIILRPQAANPAYRCTVGETAHHERRDNSQRAAPP
ncbi:MAG: hypothetical protein CM15mP120_20040 [Pseudomonadota bacterium]|nr:MAG: hypothetical protein CM15mP120_20040 [Pseudomonadota bacterium]